VAGHGPSLPWWLRPGIADQGSRTAAAAAIGLYKSELIKKAALRETSADVELATAG
jgi:hypothetical protein